VNQLFGEYRQEGLTMPYTMEDFRREVALEYFQQLTPRERREYFQQLTPRERREFLQQLTPEERREYLQQLTPEERLQGLSADEIKAYLAKLDKVREAKGKKTKRRSR
jgi:Mg/Co/Ni transporter MgtE